MDTGAGSGARERAGRPDPGRLRHPRLQNVHGVQDLTESLLNHFMAGVCPGQKLRVLHPPARKASWAFPVRSVSFN